MKYALLVLLLFPCTAYAKMETYSSIHRSGGNANEERREYERQQQDQRAQEEAAHQRQMREQAEARERAVRHRGSEEAINLRGY